MDMFEIIGYKNAYHHYRQHQLDTNIQNQFVPSIFIHSQFTELRLFVRSILHAKRLDKIECNKLLNHLKMRRVRDLHHS